MSNLDTSTQAILRCAQALQDAAQGLPTRFVRGLFGVNRGGFVQPGVVAGYNKIEFVVAQANFDNWFDVSTFRYTPQLPGWYLFHLNVTGTYAAATDMVQAAIFINGALTASGVYSPANSIFSSSSVTSLIVLNGTTDYAEGYVYMPPAPVQIEGALDETYMFGLRLTGL